MLQQPELLAPAGSLETLKYAVMYGADAVYCALPEFGMRAAPVNLTVGELHEGCIFAHARGKKVYLTLNTLPTNEELSKLPRYIQDAAEAGVDYVKTSTGRAGAPALSHIRVMREALPEGVGVKFSGFGTLNAPELALWAFFLGADVLGSPCGNVLVDTLASGYAEVGMQGPR